MMQGRSMLLRKVVRNSREIVRLVLEALQTCLAAQSHRMVVVSFPITVFIMPVPHYTCSLVNVQLYPGSGPKLGSSTTSLRQ